MRILDRLAARPSSTPAAQALEQAEQGVAVFWRPGCVFCQRLRAGVQRADDGIAWVNIWKDPEGAAFVRSVNGGNETVPTVVIDGQAHTNPHPRLVRTALAGRG